MPSRDLTRKDITYWALVVTALMLVALGLSTNDLKLTERKPTPSSATPLYPEAEYTHSKLVFPDLPATLHEPHCEYDPWTRNRDKTFCGRTAQKASGL